MIELSQSLRAPRYREKPGKLYSLLRFHIIFSGLRVSIYFCDYWAHVVAEFWLQEEGLVLTLLSVLHLFFKIHKPLLAWYSCLFISLLLFKSIQVDSALVVPWSPSEKKTA